MGSLARFELLRAALQLDGFVEISGTGGETRRSHATEPRRWMRVSRRNCASNDPSAYAVSNSARAPAKSSRSASASPSDAAPRRGYGLNGNDAFAMVGSMFGAPS